MMGGLVGGGGKPDTSAAERQIEMQRQETERMRMQAEQERRDLSEQMASKRMARARGGSRMLLSEARLNPEAGVDETLGGQ
jgi:iron only hydrogenase large subunit-like protein